MTHHRWSQKAPGERVALDETATATEGLALAPVMPTPARCAVGHRYVERGHRWLDGALARFACGEVPSVDGRGYVTVSQRS